MTIRFEGVIFSWRGPAPFLFLAIPDQPSGEIRSMAATLTYGWGVIPARVTLGKTQWTTSLFPKDGRYLIPIKKIVQTSEGVGEGHTVEVAVELG